MKRKNKLLYGKNCIGQKVISNYGDIGIIKDMFTIDGSKCMVKISYEDGIEQTREKYLVSFGRFKKPIRFNLEKELNNGFIKMYGYEDYYIINKDAVIKRIKGINTGRIKEHSNHYKYSSYDRKSIKNNPYKAVSLYKNGKENRKVKLVHRLVVETFIRPLKKMEEVNHINGISSDNRLCNLEIVSRLENNKKYQCFSKYELTKGQEEKMYSYCMNKEINLNQFIAKALKAYIEKEVK